jgi:hypothetical protein
MRRVSFVIAEGSDRRLRIPARRPPDDAGDPGGDEGQGGSPRPVNIPDIVFSLRIPELLPNGLDAEQQNLVREGFLEQARKNGYPDAGVHLNFVAAQSTTQIGIWLVGPSPAEFDDAKKAGLRLSAVGIPSENHFSISVNNGTIEREVDRRWASGEIPRHYDDGGNACFGEDCDIDIDGVFAYFTDLDSPFNPRRDRIYTIVGGKYTPAFPDVEFTATTTDIFTIENGRIAITSSTSVDTETSIFNVLTAAFLLVGTIFTSAFGIGVGVVPFIAAAVFGTEDAIIHLQGDAQVPGVGQFVVSKFFPKVLKLPGLPEIPLTYNGVFAGGGALVSATGKIVLLIGEKL